MLFLGHSNTANKTQQARLTHLRRLAQTLHTGDVANLVYKQNYEQLRLLKLPRDSNGKRSGQARERKALKPEQVFEAMKHWPDDTNMGKRNQALLGVLFYAGLRRSEAVALRWSDIDLDNDILTVRHGKGDKERTIPFARERAAELLRVWRQCIPDYEYVFVAVNKGDNIQADKPISTETVRRVCVASGDFKPHDARRTLLTNLLTSGTPLPAAQFIAGHQRPSSTLEYAIVNNANDAKQLIKINY